MKFILGLLLLLPFFSRAGDCHYLKVTSIQPQSSNVLVQVQNSSGTYWKSIGNYSSESTSSYQAIIQQALATGFKVMLRFPSEHNCNVTDYETKPIAIRIYQ